MRDWSVYRVGMGRRVMEDDGAVYGPSPLYAVLVALEDEARFIERLHGWFDITTRREEANTTEPHADA